MNKKISRVRKSTIRQLNLLDIILIFSDFINRIKIYNEDIGKKAFS